MQRADSDQIRVIVQGLVLVRVIVQGLVLITAASSLMLEN